MQITIEKLRRWMLLAAALIVAGIAALLLIAQHERRKLLRDLPAKLGIDIQQQTNEFTYSQSIQGKTLFTLHAAKAVQMKAGGGIKLHDVTIILYGRKQDRADRIAGEEFDYDPSSGVARAAGDVFLDLQAPAKAVVASTKSSAAVDATKNLADAKAAGVVHVTTHGLVFEQKEGLASTDQEITFQFGGGVTGHARGAQYDSGRGIITLDAAVAADTTLHGRPVHLTAAHGELNRDTNLCVFTNVSYSADGETATADQATIQLRTDGSAERVDTNGNVTITMAGGGTIRTPHAVVAMNAVSEPKDLQANSGVSYADSETTATGSRDAHGDAAAAHVVFDDNGVIQRAELSGGVHTLDREKDKTAAGWTERELHAVTVDTAFRTESGTTTLHEVKALGNAQMRLMAPVGTPAAKSSQSTVASETTTLAGDTLDAIFPAGAATTPETVHGTGHTVLTQTAADGTVSESHGDMLDAQMRLQAHNAKTSAQPASQIVRAVQQGHVTLTQTPAAKNPHAQPMTATADRAEYTGSDDTLLLTGTAQADPQVTDGGGTQGAMQIAARRIRVLRASGDALLTGDVRGNYAGAGSQPPAHIVADHAEVHRSDQHAIFYGAANGSSQQRARLWQDASQVEAPVLDFDRAAQRLTASGNPNDAAAVHAVFASASTPQNSTSQKKTSGVVRVASRKMVYLSQAAGNAARQAEFSGGVAVESGDGTIKAQRAVVDLAPADAGKAAANGAATPLPVLGGNVQRIVASGQVALTESGRQGFGEQLVYTPNPPAANANPTGSAMNATKSSGHFVLTGTAAAPPRLVDPAKGTITGGSLIFNSGDDSVVVSGGSGTAGRVHTELKVTR